MRIISKQHDYYDCIQAYGQDRNVVYVREPLVECSKCHKLVNPSFNLCRNCKEKLKGEHQSFPTLKEHWRYSNRILYSDQHIIGICGKIYPMLELYAHEYQKSEPSFCMNINDVDKFIEDNFKQIQVDNYHASKNEYSTNRPKTPILRKNVVSLFEECKLKLNHYESLFIDHKSPIFVASYRHLNGYHADNINGSPIYNALLSDVKFYRVMDQQTIFQEINMYLTGVLGISMERGKPTYKGEKMSDAISDADRASLKGYDKWSFRKEPSERKRKKKMRK